MTELSARAVTAASAAHGASRHVDGHTIVMRSIRRPESFLRRRVCPSAEQTSVVEVSAPVPTCLVDPGARRRDEVQQVNAVNTTPPLSIPPGQHLHTEPFQC